MMGFSAMSKQNAGRSWLCLGAGWQRPKQKGRPVAGAALGPPAFDRVPSIGTTSYPGPSLWMPSLTGDFCPVASFWTVLATFKCRTFFFVFATAAERGVF